MIAELLLALVPLCAGQAQAENPLALDPRTLPRDPSARWKDFDPSKMRPEELPPQWRAVQAAIEARDLPRALEGLQQTLRGAPDFPPAWHQLGMLYFRLQR